MAQTLAHVRAALRRDTALLARVEKRLADNIKLARELGATAVQIGEDVGKTPGRISHIAPKPKKERPAPAAKVEAPAARVPLEGDALPTAFRPGATSYMTKTLSGLVSDNWSQKRDERRTIFVDQVSGQWQSPGGKSGRIDWRDGAAAALLDQVPETVERVYLVGSNRPGVREDTRHLFDSEADAVRVWFLTTVPGWSVSTLGHYLADEDHPIGRWERDGRTVEVARASTWFGEGRYSVADASAAWCLMRLAVRGFGPDAILLSTPASTGKDLWRRTIGRTKDGAKKEYPVLSTELRQLIHATSGQGRREVVAGEPGEHIGQFVQYDMRFAYAALAWGMPVGEPTMWTKKKLDQAADDDRRALLAHRGRWLVTAHVPSNWERVGLLGAPITDGGWTYPARPGQTFTTWASGAELKLADRYGWRLDLHEGFTFREEKPLNVWRDRLTKLYGSAEALDAPPVVQQLVRAALRNMVLMTIGSFAGRTRMVTKYTRMDSDTAPPSNRQIRVAGDYYLWEEEGIRSEWTQRTDHPEWSAEIWARCRARLLEAPTGDRSVKAGALHVPPGSVLGMRTDALYLSADPKWADDGEPGRFRLKGQLVGDLVRPTDEATLEVMKKKASGE